MMLIEPSPPTILATMEGSHGKLHPALISYS